MIMIRAMMTMIIMILTKTIQFIYGRDSSNFSLPEKNLQNVQTKSSPPIWVAWGSTELHQANETVK